MKILPSRKPVENTERLTNIAYGNYPQEIIKYPQNPVAAGAKVSVDNVDKLEA